jgi:uncharacterized SAM-binding protein YcdF (DUF218 family)
MLRRARRLLSGFLALAVVGWVLTIALVWWSSRRDDASTATGRVADAIVVLGAAQYAGRPSPVLQARLDHAHMLFDRNLAPYVILTGGRGDGDTQSEAGAGRRYLVKHGVPDSVILYEDEGRTTFTSMHNAAERVRAVNGRTVLLVSDPFHMLRLSLLARLHGLAPLASPTLTSPISANPLLEFEYAVRESLAVPADVAQFLLEKLRNIRD